MNYSLAFLLALVFGLNALAQSRQNIQTGAGSQTCGSWVESRSGSGSLETQLKRSMMVSWVQGYLYGMGQGLGIASGAQAPVFAPPPADAIQVWLDGYCRNHPLELISEASGQLVRELVAKN